MRKLVLCAALLCAAGSAMADVARMPNGDYISILRKDCSAQVLESIPPRFRELLQPDLQAAEAQVDGKVFQACWLLREDGKVLIVYEDGDVGFLSRNEFKPGV